MNGIPLIHLLILGAILFSLGLTAVLLRRNALGILIGIELMLNAANLNFVAFWRYGAMDERGGAAATIAVLFSLTIAAAEAAVGLGIVLMVYRYYRSAEVDAVKDLNG